MLELGVKTLLSYLLGSLIGSLIVGRLRGGVDIRKLGSGNPGGTNALRTQGPAFALWVILIDAGKGWLAAAVRIRRSIGSGSPSPAQRLWSWVMCIPCGMVSAAAKARQRSSAWCSD
jgi:glycerol-3-phosphate acyltransferase PlsY